MFSMLLAGGLVASLVGCGGVPTNSNSGSTSKVSTKDSGLDWNKTNDPSLKGQTITILWVNTPGPDSSKTQLLKEFTKETGIQVVEQGVDYNSLYTKITTAAMSGSSDVDLLDMDTIWSGQFYKAKITEDLTNVVPKEAQNVYTDSALTSCIYQGHLMALPQYSSTTHFYYNKALLAKAEITTPPKTWDEFKIDAEKLKAKGIYAFGGAWKQGEMLNIGFDTFDSSFGGKLLDNNGQPAFNDEKGVQALQFMVDSIKNGYTDPASVQWSGTDAKNAFAAGEFAMTSDYEGFYPMLNDPTKSKVVNQTDVSLIPGEGNVVSTSVTGTEGLGISTHSKHKEAALALIKWMASKNYQLKEYTGNGDFPATKALYNDPDFITADTTKMATKLAEQYKYAVNRPSAPGYVAWADNLAAELHKAILGQESAKQALDTAAQKMKDAMANN